METFFTDAFGELPAEELEVFYRTVFMNMPSEAAMALRCEYYRTRLRHMGKNVKIGCGVTFVNPQNISLGDNVSIGDHCTLIAHSERGITLGNDVAVKYGVYLDTETAEGYIEVGVRVYIGTGCCLHGHQGLEIGDDCLLAQNITITPYSHKFENPKETISSQGGNTRKVTIERDCYLGKNVCVVYSADVQEGSVIGSGSVVVKTIPPYSVAVGNPARVIRKRGEPRM